MQRITRRVGAVVAAMVAVVALGACNPSNTTAEARGLEASYGGGAKAQSCQETAGKDPSGPVMWEAKGTCRFRFADGSAATISWGSRYTPNDRNIDVVVTSGSWTCYGNGAGSNWHFSRCTVREG